MQKVAILVIAMLCYISIQAQVVPGYQGKRTYFEYNFHGVPSILGVAQNGKKFGFGDEKSLSSWSIRHRFNLNYVTKRNTEVGGSFSTSTIGLPDSINQVSILRFSSIGFHTNRYLVKSTGALAPLGRYVRFETQYVQSATFPINRPRSNFHFGYLGIGFGSRSILKDFLTLNFSFQSGLIVPFGASTNSQSENYELNLVRKRLQNYLLYEANIGIGILLF